ncbi:hypothetical protein CC2G_011828 [Coprinopsis cinerea AmutBmut pab1-1]|nr:hypothetical protein CC2G_011828 [Coprinopsis cinerea AmutBmut pab1-1]
MPLSISMPFSLSYLVMTPGRVRLPGETVVKKSSPPSSPTSRRWSTDLSTKARSIRARAGSMGPFRRLSSGPSQPSKASNNEADCLLEDEPLAIPRPVARP